MGMEKVADDVYLERSFGNVNLGLIANGEELVMVDAPLLPTQAYRWREELANYGAVRYLVLTDDHRNHALGSAFFPGQVVGHKLTREKMLFSERALEQLKSFLAGVDPEGAAALEMFHPRPPTMTFSLKLTLYLDMGPHLDMGPLELLHMPGHTPNTIAAYLPRQGVVFTGDTLVNGSHPYLGQANLASWLDSLDKLEGLASEIFIPGHGGPCGREAIAVLRDYLEELRELVSAAISRGLSRREATDSVDLLDRFPPPQECLKEVEGWYRAGIGRVYDELLEERG